MKEYHHPTRGGWAYISLISALPGLSTNDRSAIIVQFCAFEGVALLLAVTYNLWQLLPFATTAIVVSTFGSYLMVNLSDRIQSHNPPDSYQRILFDSSIDIVMGLVAFIALLTYLLIDAQAPGPGLLDRLFGNPAPPLAVFFALFVAWDLTYRIGIGWWTSITGLWRTITLRTKDPGPTNNTYTRADFYTMIFAGSQLLLVPFLWSDRLLAWLLLGHIFAVFTVSSFAIGFQLHR